MNNLLCLNFNVYLFAIRIRMICGQDGHWGRNMLKEEVKLAP